MLGLGRHTCPLPLIIKGKSYMSKTRATRYEGDRIYFTSDLHLGHRNIITYCNRPYADPEEMNAALIDNWNNTVEDNDVIYILGDVSFATWPTTLICLSEMRGRKHLILGNHDYHHEKDYRECNLFESVDVYREINIDGSNVVLFHYPIDSWNGAYRQSYHLHGHVHSKDGARKGKRMDVGVDSHNYTPTNWLDLKVELDE